MYRIMIVDDEQWIVDGLKLLIPWKEYGFEVICEANDGKTGVELATQYRPHVVITDIRMPLMDGYAMIDSIKEMGLDCQYIILSGYSDFEYAQGALLREVYFYLLKPVQREELVKTIVGIGKKLDFRVQRKQELDALREQLGAVWPVVKERYLVELITDEFLDESAIEKRWRFFSPEQDLECFCVMLIEIDSVYSRLKDRIEEILLLEFAVRNITEELVREKHIGFVFNRNREKLCVLCYNGEIPGEKTEKESWLQFAEYLQYTIRTVLDETVSIGIGGVYEKKNMLSTSYLEAEQALRYKMVLGTAP